MEFGFGESGFLWLGANGMCEVSNTDTGARGD